MNKNEAPENRSLLDRLIDLALEKPAAPPPPPTPTLPVNKLVDVFSSMCRYDATVVYAIPALNELMRRFPGGVNRRYGSIVFTPIKACENVSRETREVEFDLVNLGRNASTTEVLAEIDKYGLRPALPEELLAYGEAHPEVMPNYIAALGSFSQRHNRADSYDSRDVAYLWRDGRGWHLDFFWLGLDWNAEHSFLAVRK